MRIDLPSVLQDAAYLARLLQADISRDPIPPIWGIATDSREVQKGDLFVALAGNHTAGARFLENARAAGAVAALVRKGILFDGMPLLCVADPVTALLRAAGEYRRRQGELVIAVSGSTGKTTVKEALATVLSGTGRVEKSQGNFNSRIGMPLSILSMQEADHWVLELGINHCGEMTEMARVAAPNLAILTNVGTAHIGNFGSYAALLSEKAQIAVSLQENGILLIPAALPLEGFPCACRMIHRVGKGGDFYLENIRYSEWGTTGDLIAPDRVITNLAWPIAGGAGAAVLETVGAAAILLGLDEERIRTGLFEAGERTPRCSRIRVGKRLLIDDTYNASPEAVVTAIEGLVLIAAGRPAVAVLGDMLELGKYSAMLHRTVGRAVARSGVEQLFTYGKAALDIAKGAEDAGLSRNAIFIFDEGEQSALCEALCRTLPQDAAVLFKASGRMGLDRILSEVRRRISL